MSMKNHLLDKVHHKDMRCGVIGLGYVGLPLAVAFASAGFHTMGLDVNQDKIDQLNHKQNYINDVDTHELQAVMEKNILRVTADFSQMKDLDFIMVCVPTPLDSHKQPDMKHITESCEQLAKYVTPRTAIVLESTTYPGTTEDLIRPLLEEKSGLVCGEDFYLGFSPERIDPGNAVFNVKNTPKIVGAIGDDALEVIASMYRAALHHEIFTVSSPSIAEMAKLLENTYRNVNIGLINEIAQLCNKIDIDIWEVIEAAKTKPYGFQAFYPGPGLGGHCIPLDPYYLSWKARAYDFHTSMIESSMIINDKMPSYCVERANKILNHHKKPIHGSRILLIGIAYKRDLSDYRESPALDIYDLLKADGADISYYDPHVAAFENHGETVAGLPELTAEMVKESDLLIIATGHKNVDYAMIQKNAKAVFDARNILHEWDIDGDNIYVL